MKYIGSVVKTPFLIGKVKEVVDLPPSPLNPERLQYLKVTILSPTVAIGREDLVRVDEVDSIEHQAHEDFNAEEDDEYWRPKTYVPTYPDNSGRVSNLGDGIWTQSKESEE